MILLRTPFYFSAVGLSLCSSSPSDFLFLYSRRHWHIIGFTLLSTPWVLSPALTFYSPAGRLTSYHTLFVWHGDWMGLWLKKRESRFSRNGSYFLRAEPPWLTFKAQSSADFQRGIPSILNARAPLTCCALILHQAPQNLITKYSIWQIFSLNISV